MDSSSPPNDNSTKRAKAAGAARSLLNRVSSRTSAESPRGEETTLGKAPSNPTVPSMSPEAMPLPSTPKNPSNIDTSVRTFRLFEALRRGDTATIGRAIQDSSGARSENAARTSTSSTGSGALVLEGTTVLHLAIQCADLPIIEYILSSNAGAVDVNAQDKDGNTPLHLAASLNRLPVARLLLEQNGVDDTISNYQGRTAMELSTGSEVFQQLQLARSIFVDSQVKELHRTISSGNYNVLEKLLADTHFQHVIDINGPQLATDPTTTESGGTLLHEAAQKRDNKLIEILLLNGADPFQRDRKGRLPQDVTKDERTRAFLKKSPAVAAAQRGVQERTILAGATGSAAAPASGENALGGKSGREMHGYLKKWTNYTSGNKLRWFVLEDGVLSYYKQQDDAGSACRGAINMRIAQLHVDAQDKTRFEILGKASVKYYLKANHEVEAKRWVWALNNAIQYAKDEAKATAKNQDRSSELLRQAKVAELERKQQKNTDSAVGSSSGHSQAPSKPEVQNYEDDDDTTSNYGPSEAGNPSNRLTHRQGPTASQFDTDDEDDQADDGSSVEVQPETKDAFMTAAHSARLQLHLLSQMSAALQTEQSRNPGATISQPAIAELLTSYDTAVANLNSLVGDLGRIARDREGYWQHRLEQERRVRRLWEDNLTKVAMEHDELETRIGESEEKRKRTKKALRDALENQMPTSNTVEESPVTDTSRLVPPPTDFQSRKARASSMGGRRKSTFAEMADIAGSASEDEDDDEFFDAIGTGEVEVVQNLPPPVVAAAPLQIREHDERPKAMEPVLPTKQVQGTDFSSSFKGYEDPVRTRLTMDADNRPKVSLWGILKSMIGKDVSKISLPVSFNEPTSLLQRVAEDMEYADLLDMAAKRTESMERMVYVAAYAISEYASTIGRVAKPFNPVLGETYEYARPDKGYRFVVEQVSHHPPIAAAVADAENWTYSGESAIVSKFFGKSFEVNLLGTWFLRLRPTSSSGAEDVYTWKKVTSAVTGIITGSPTVDNYGPMEIKNHTTGDVCVLDFKQRGWKSSSAYQVIGKISGPDGKTRWSIGGRWNDKVYARLTPGYEEVLDDTGSKSKDANPNKAFLVWEAHKRPNGVPFNLTPFGVTLNALPAALKPVLPPTDTRLRPDQRAMEDGEYDRAATEKNRVEEKQRAARKERELRGDEYQPRWFKRGVSDVTGEKCWVAIGGSADPAAKGSGMEYWSARSKGDWTGSSDIF